MDEWNVWHQRANPHHTDVTGPFKSKPPLAEDDQTMADALVVGCLLITLLRHADRVKVACLAQLVNVIPPMRTLDGGPAWRQPSFFPFMHAARWGRGTVLRIEPDAPAYDVPDEGPVPALEATAVLGDGELTLFAVNRTESPLPLDARLRDLDGVAVAEHIVLADDPDASNTPEQPDRVAPVAGHRRDPRRRPPPRRAAAAVLERAAPDGRRARSGLVSDAHVVGIDFGTLSGRAVVVRVADGAELGSAVHEYASAVIEDALPATGEKLPPDWALQDPDDYVAVLREAVPAALAAAGVEAGDVVGIGTDFTASTPLPVTADGTPLCRLDGLRERPHAYVKLWKHHAAQSQADRITGVAAERGEWWLPRYGGRISSEWQYAKALQVLEEDPEIYARMDRWIEAADWIVWQLCGQETRNVCTAGYKAIHQDEGYPSPGVPRGAQPGLRRLRGRQARASPRPSSASAPGR